MQPFRLLTANLWNERTEPSAFARVIERHAPDIVLAQEITPEQAEVLARALPHGLFAPSRDTHGMAIALRWPARCERLALPGRDALTARIEPGVAGAIARELAIVNVHLSAPTRLGRSALRRAQVAALERHLRALPNAHARVLAGDFNSLPFMPAYLALRRGLSDAARARARFPRATWSPGARWPRLLRIDHVFVRGVRPLALDTLRIEGSDHSALLATLVFD